MFGPPGRAYVYFTYGMHFCLNVVTCAEGTAGAVLLRAGEIVEGIDIARARRPASKDRDLARGPARLTVALGVTGDLDGSSLMSTRSPLRLRLADPVAHELIATSARTGVGGAGAPTPWRFFLRDEPSVSPYRAAV
jgi:DNA-3-methyladenine glycosylase